MEVLVVRVWIEIIAPDIPPTLSKRTHFPQMAARLARLSSSEFSFVVANYRARLSQSGKRLVIQVRWLKHRLLWVKEIAIGADRTELDRKELISLVSMWRIHFAKR
jgi:hypothetical protein